VARRVRARFHFEVCWLSRASVLCSSRQMRFGFFTANMIAWVLIFVALKIALKIIS
jgi:hypothetical protein